MLKRIFAWILLAGFVLLLLNLIVFRVYWQISMVVYILIVFGFILSGGNLFYKKRQDEFDLYGSNNKPDNPDTEVKSDDSTINQADGNIENKNPTDDNTVRKDFK